MYDVNCDTHKFIPHIGSETCLPNYDKLETVDEKLSRQDNILHGCKCMEYLAASIIRFLSLQVLCGFQQLLKCTAKYT